MSEPSNPTARVIDVVNFLAANPTESFSLAEIARHIGLSNGSAHRILTTLSGAQFLARNERRRTYSLGPALVAIGHAAVEKHRGIEVARREIAKLVSELKVQCTGNAIVGTEMLVLVKEGTPQSHRGVTRVGERWPLLPPIGLCHTAWASRAEIDAYCALASDHLDPAVDARLAETFPLIRARGYGIAANGPNASLSQLANAAAGRGRDPAYWDAVFDMIRGLTPDELQLREITDAGAKGIAYITAPVFSPAGEVALEVLITGLPTSLPVTEIERYAERLCGAAAAITAETHGRMPEQ